MDCQCNVAIEPVESRNTLKRTGWDSNPRYPEGHTSFRDWRVQPLRHLSEAMQYCTSFVGVRRRWGKPGGETRLRLELRHHRVEDYLRLREASLAFSATRLPTFARIDNLATVRLELRHIALCRRLVPHDFVH